MKELHIIDSLEQIKCLSDPLRIKLIQLLGDKPLTSQMLAEKVDLPRSKVHYHLKELERNKLIHIVKTEQVRNFLQVFYEPIAANIIPSPELLQSLTNEIISNKVYMMQIAKDDIQAFEAELKQLLDKYKGDMGNQVTISLSIKE